MTIPVSALLSPAWTQSPQGSRRNAVKIHFLEIVTPDVDSACDLYSMMYGVTFGDANADLGGARTADLDGGGMLGVRAPLRDTETPVVRPYVLVDDISAAVSAAAEAGAEIAMTPTEITGYGQFAIVIHGGIESGLWQI
jgi:predicted enzyme related to lactoylglutathione lyase